MKKLVCSMTPFCFKVWSCLVIAIAMSCIAYAGETTGTALKIKPDFEKIVLKKNGYEYWEILKNKAEKLYKTWDIKADVNVGYLVAEKSTTGVADGASAGVTVRVPLYSASDRASKEKEIRDFLDKGSKLIQILDTNKNGIERLMTKAGLLKAVMADQGITGINAYYDCVEEIIKKQQEIKEAERELEIMCRENY